MSVASDTDLPKDASKKSETSSNSARVYYLFILVRTVSLPLWTGICRNEKTRGCFKIAAIAGRCSRM